MLLNVQGFNPGGSSKTKWKIGSLQKEIESRTSSGWIPAIIALTETHLKPRVEKAQLQIPNYDVRRSDRRLRKNGGVLLYIHNEIPITDCSTFDNSVCEAVTITSSVRNSLVIGAYRPPDASLEEFREMLPFIQKIIDDNQPCEITVMGDFNFPNISWPDKSFKRTTLVSSDSTELLFQFLDNNFLSQFVDKPTREDSILDLILSSSNEVIPDVVSEKTELSDHNLVETPLSPNHKLSFSQTTPQNKPPQGFRALSLAQANFKKINQSLSQTDWNSLKSSCSSEEFPEIFNKTVLDICSKYCPKKSTNPRSKGNKLKQSSSLHKLSRAKRKLKARLRAIESCNPQSPNLPELRSKLGKLCLEIRDKAMEKIHTEEANVIKNIKSNPKRFFTYVKSKSKTKSLISLLINKDKKVLTGAKEMADCFQDFFTSVFSDPNSSDKKLPDFTSPNIEHPLEQLDYSLLDIEKAIDCIKSSSAAPDNEIPALVLKSCKKNLSLPIKLIWDESLSTGIIPKHFKKQLVAPIHKKDSIVFPPNHRPISLTSHVIKIFERVLRNHLVEYLEKNNIINPNQHGFRQGKSCLTQLLAHYDELIINALEGNETDVIYIDFAKAFDKIDHEILLAKLLKYGINGKLFEWIKKFSDG